MFFVRTNHNDRICISMHCKVEIVHDRLAVSIQTPDDRYLGQCDFYFAPETKFEVVTKDFQE